MSEELMKLLVARKSGSAGRQSGTLGLANPGRELSLADLSKKLTKRNLANVCATAMSISRWERESRCPSADFLIRFGIPVEMDTQKIC